MFRFLAPAIALPLLMTAPLAAQSTDSTDVTFNDPLTPSAAFTASGRAAYNWTGPSIGVQFGYIDGDNGDEDVIGGFRINYDNDLGRYVIGGGVDYDFTSIDLDGGNEIEGILRLKARFGIDGGRSLYYVTGGFASAIVESGGDGDGYFVGGGYEVFLTDRVTLGAEVLFHDFDDFSGGENVDTTTAQVSINFRF